MNEEKLMVKKETIIRTALLILAIINNGLALFNKSPLPFDNEAVKQVISWGFTAAAAIWSWWKNNNFTQAALQGQKVVDMLKGKVKEEK